jgi:dipeptidyl aminopeptidase/acylaminoacyl peptidase
MNGIGTRSGLVVAALVVCSASVTASPGPSPDAAKHPIDFDDLIKMHRVAEPQISPDGKWVAYTLTTPDMDANRNASNIWLVSTESGAPIQLTQSGHDSSPVWSPDGKTLAFISSRAGDSQVYILSMDGGEAHAWTHLSTGADMVKWSPDGKMLAFTSSVYPDCKDDACNKLRDEEKEKNKVKAHVAEHLLYRHWTHWSEGKRGHLFVVPAPAAADQAEASAVPRDLTEGADYDVPPDERGGPEDINFSPDSKELCFTAVTDKMEATSTNGGSPRSPASTATPCTRRTANTSPTTRRSPPGTKPTAGASCSTIAKPENPKI